MYVCVCAQYELHLSASDNLKENHTIVVIHVKDVNDNPPVFERPTYRTQITEEDDRNLPKRVLQVRRARISPCHPPPCNRTESIHLLHAACVSHDSFHRSRVGTLLRHTRLPVCLPACRTREKSRACTAAPYAR